MNKHTDFLEAEIHWWVFKRETDLDELQEVTENARNSVQKLKESSIELTTTLPNSYEQLVLMLLNFAEIHKSEIETLYEYVTWLSTRDPLAPSILYTYRVWGTTRLSQRRIDYPFNRADELPIEKYVEVACGLFLDDRYTLDSVRRDVETEAAESFDLENPSYYQPSERNIIFSVAHKTFGEFTTYFEKIRDSLRNVILDIE